MPNRIVVVGASTGGPVAVREFLDALPPEFAFPVVVAQHLPDRFSGMLTAALRATCRLPVETVVDGLAVRPGVVHVAEGVCVRFAAPDLLQVRPSPPGPAANIDALFSSAALVHGSAVVAVLLTGMGGDGLDGARRVHAAGGTVFTQDAESSVVWGLPGAVTGAGLSSFSAPPAGLAAELLRRLC